MRKKHGMVLWINEMLLVLTVDGFRKAKEEGTVMLRSTTRQRATVESTLTSKPSPIADHGYPKP